MNNNNSAPYDLDWGIATPDGFSVKDQQLLLVFNVDISSLVNIERSITFIIGRVLWFNLQAIGTAQKVVFDLRGQPLTLLSRARKMRNDILQNLLQLNSSINIIVEILI
jgi:hypothetical protein